uniref:Uncharacterized protein n=1 Tax=Oryza glumipatula TaxID=40148 RepID=A0A0D9Y2Y1_9ORYZ
MDDAGVAALVQILQSSSTRIPFMKESQSRKRSRRRDFSLERMEPCEWMDKDLMPWRRRSYGRSDGDCILRRKLTTED